jgi:hypothetical protein
MTRKSAAKVKPVKFDKPELPPIEETFENAKQAFITTADVAVELAHRVDNLVNIRKAYYEYYHADISEKGIPRDIIEKLKQWQNMTIECYKSIAKIVHSFELEEFLKDEMKDYFAPLMPVVEGIETDNDLFEAFLIFGIVKPWGEKMNALHHQMLDEKKAREEVE